MANLTAGDKIVLGSGKLYITDYTYGETIPTDATIEIDTNLLGYIEGGCTIEYKPKFYTAQDDLGVRTKTVVTEEEVTLKSGIMTFCGKTLTKLCPTTSITEAAGKRNVKIGGINNQDGKQYLLRFVHADPQDGTIRISVCGQNQAGFKVAFVKDKETVIDAEFTCQPIDNTGVKVIYTEDIPSAS